MLLGYWIFKVWVVDSFQSIASHFEKFTCTKFFGDELFFSIIFIVISISRPYIPNIIKSGSPPYRVQPGKIEDYTPGFSSLVVDKKEVGSGF